MEPDQHQNFNDRLSQWVSKQGFWFQIRYSISGAGLKGRVLFHFFKFSLSLLVLLLLLALGSWIILVKRMNSVRFVESKKEEIQSGLFASDLEMIGCRFTQGQLEITHLAAEGKNDTFFSAIEAQNISCKISPIDGLIRVWKPGIISISKLDLDLRAGADDDESAKKQAEALCYKSLKVDVNSFEVENASLRWGFSELTQGSIVSSKMRLYRFGNGWKIILNGGKFNQNWLQNLEIIHIEATCDQNEVVFQKAELQLGDGTVDFSGLRIAGGARPEVSGVAKIRNLNLERVVPPILRSFVEGSFSGDFKVKGSTNSTQGIGFEGLVNLDGKDVISLRQSIPLFRALSVLDYSRNYHRVDFKEGSFKMKTINGGMDLSDLKLKAQDLFSLEGNFKVRLPVLEEIQTTLQKTADTESLSSFTMEDTAEMKRNMAQLESNFALRKAQQKAKQQKAESQGIDSFSLFDRLRMNGDLRLMKEIEAERMSRMLRYEGSVLITIPGDAFERAPLLQQTYPINPSSGRIPIQVPIDGDIYELTYKQAAEAYALGQR